MGRRGKRSQKQSWQEQTQIVFGSNHYNGFPFRPPQQPFQFYQHATQPNYPFSDPMFRAPTYNYPSPLTSSNCTSYNFNRDYAHPMRAQPVRLNNTSQPRPQLYRPGQYSSSYLNTNGTRVESQTLRTDGNVKKFTANATTTSDNADDVVYLFTVDRTNDFLTELVDLDENAQPVNKSTNLVQSTKLLLNDTLKAPLTSEKKPRSNDAASNVNSKAASSTTGLKRKRVDEGDADCCRCKQPYEKIHVDGGELYSSRCGHRLCRNCATGLQPYRCPLCNAKLSNLWKIIL